jgi:schlafen family protein
MLDERVHDVLFSDATIKLGEIHWALLKSASFMDSKRWKVTEATIGCSYEDTNFGNEVGLDEIHWWIFKKETDVEELLAKTELTLKSAQTLKKASVKLKTKEPKSYRDLLLTLKDFAEKHSAEIDSLHAYVGWLMERDVMAPRILFTYRVWGSTRMSDREMNVEDEGNPRSDMSKLHALIEIVLGMRQGRQLVYEAVYNEIALDIYEGLDPEEMSDNPAIDVPESHVIRRTAYAVQENCQTYFTEIRDSLRHIVLDIEKFKEQRYLFQSDNFWREFITKAREAKTCETQLWDFKETLTIWRVKSDSERHKAKIALAADVASFANVSGGVLIIGVNDKRELVGIGEGGELESQLKFARDVIAEYIAYDREIASFRQVAVGEKGKEKICLIVVVSQAREAVGVSHGRGLYSYPVRRETGISWPPRVEVQANKLNVKCDNRDFMHELQQFIRDN